MDSMRSLNRSLPKSNNTRSAPPEELLQAFRTAALSVTNLYKSAVTDQSRSRQEGYQDALDDLLVFLDTENVGLQDGEGWRVRQWINDRYERTSSGGPQPDSDDDTGDTERRPRSASPNQNMQRPGTITEHQSSQSEQLVSPEKSGASVDASDSGKPTAFRFTAGQQEQEQDQSQTDQIMVGESETFQNQVQAQAPTNTATIVPARVELVQRGSRTPSRQGSRNSTRQSTREFTFNAGSKRKIQFPDFFDISSVQFGREGTGGTGKRSKLA